MAAAGPDTPRILVTRKMMPDAERRIASLFRATLNPDDRAMTPAEILDQAKRIADVTALPVLADVDTGYGGPLNTVLEGHEYIYTGNTAVLSQFGAIPRSYIGTEGACFPNATGRAISHSNTIYWDARDTNVTECGMKLEDYQRVFGGDPGSVGLPYSE